MARTKKTKYHEPNYEVGLRIATIINLLYRNPHGISRTEIQRSLGISVDTIRRYKRQVLPQLIIDGEEIIEIIKTDDGERWRIKDTTSFKDRTIRDMLSLYMAACLMDFLGGTSAQERINSLSDAMKGMMPDHFRNKLKDFEKKIYLLPYGPKDYKDHSKILEDILGALIHNEILEVEKEMRDKTITFKCNPLTLVMYKYGLYLVAQSLSDSTKIMVNKVETIKSVKRTPEFFTYPSDYNPQEFFKESFGMIRDNEKLKTRIFFDNNVADTVKDRRWHHTQKVANVDGGIEVEFELQGTRELIPWVLSYGEHAKIIEPQILIDEISDIANKIIKIYS